jgi:valyl-tRNA synthetase
MIMAGYFFMGERPFHTVYLHGTVRDMNHVKMSKSLGNGIDPLDVVKLFGADALRYTVIAGMGLGTDVILDPNNLEQSFAPGRNFTTKLWNIGRFLLGNVGDQAVVALDDVDPARLTRADAWVLERLDTAIAECDAALGPARPNGPGAADRKWAAEQANAGLRLMEYTEAARRFTWDELAAWYLESAKARVAADAADAADRDVARSVLVHAFDAALRLLHPVVPFITESLWQRLPGHDESEFLARARWPQSRQASDARALEFELAREAVSAIRQIRADYNVPPGRSVDVTIVGHGEAARRVLGEEAALIGRLTRSTVAVRAEQPTVAAAHALLSDGSHVIVPLAGAIDLEKECARLRAELTQLDKQLTGLEQRLGNENFIRRAKPDVVEAERRKLTEWSARRVQLQGKVKALCGG